MSIKSQFQVAVVSEINENTQVTVAAMATTSSILNCGGTAPTGIFLPSAFVSCNITFNVCKTPGGTFLPLTNFDGSAFVVAGVANQYTPLLPAMFNSVVYIQLGFSVAQTDAEIIDFNLAPIYQGIQN